MEATALAARSLTAAATSSVRELTEPQTAREKWRRRISYFMLFRLGMLAVFTVLATTLAITGSRDYDSMYTGFVWGALVVGFALTIVFARMLPHVRDLRRFAAVQTSADIVLAAVVVQMSGGVESGFVWLYLIAVLGAATMAGRRQTWAAALLCVTIIICTAAAQWLGVLEPTTLGEPLPLMDPLALWSSAGRTVAAMLGVTVLSSYLNRQLATSVTEAGELRALNENIVRSLSSGLVTVDVDGKLLYFNPAAEAILDLREDDLGSHIEAVMPGLDDEIDRRAGDDSRLELELSGRAGRPLHVGLSRTALVDSEGRQGGHVINFQDLTRLHELTEQVRRNERLAALGGLAASVAHEIRNPLTAIGGSAELLATSPDASEEDVRLLAVIQRESGRLSDMITDLLAFTRPQPPQIGEVSLAPALREARDAFATDPANEGVEVEVDADEVSESVKVAVDPAQLSQVIWNLLRNAAEAMEGVGRIVLRVRTGDERVRLEVRDDGPGIPDDRIERIFDPFFTTKERGTGFGLAIVHRIVADNGGAIGVDSRPGKGATFIVRLRRA